MAVRAGQVMSVTLGVILAHTGTVAFALIQPHTSCRDRAAAPGRLSLLLRGGACRIAHAADTSNTMSKHALSRLLQQQPGQLASSADAASKGPIHEA
jgi:hypothetical protein